MYLDVRPFPGGYRIAGTYVVKGDQATVRFRLRQDREAVTDWIEIEGMVEEVPERIAARAMEAVPP